jgi:hypothetical protein
LCTDIAITKVIPLPLGITFANPEPLTRVEYTTEFLEWFSKSIEYETWSGTGHSASLWLHGGPADGKTVAATYVLESLPNQYPYDKPWDVASIFCTDKDSEIGLVASLAYQLLGRNERAQAAQETKQFKDLKKKLKPDPDKETFEDSSLVKIWWQLLQLSIMTMPRYEIAIIIDGIDKIGNDASSSFLKQFVLLQKRIQSKIMMRVLISSRPFSDIRQALTHYPSIEKGKERRGKRR